MHDAINATRSKCVKKYFILESSCLLLLLLLQHYSYGRKSISLSRSYPMTAITLRNTKQEIIDEAVPLIEDQAQQIQDLTEKLKAAFILLGFTAAAAALF